MKPVVLIVDDSLTVRMDLAEAFDAAGFHPVPCPTAADAREALAHMPVAMVILDVLLPDADGIDVLRDLRAAPATAATPILLLSTEAEVRDRIRGLATGADEYVGKPYDTSYVVARARELMHARGDTAATAATTILVVDDSATFREELRQVLEGAGHAVVTAASGEDGLRLAADLRPDALVVDGVMPGIDGTTVIARIRLDAALRHMPCLLLTADDDRAAELRALDAGADAFVRKGDDLALVLARLAAILRAAKGRPSGDDTASLAGPKKILAVDDSATYLNELASALRGEGYDVVLAHSGEEALELLAVQSVDCILLDLMMPGLGGHEACRRVKAAPQLRDIPLIMLTALEEREAMLQGLAAGADDYIAKSSDFDVLRARVRAQMRRRQFEDENRFIRERLLRSEIEAMEARAARALAETRASMVEELERRVQARTADLAKANADLQQEVEERKRAEAALLKSEEQLRQSQKMEAIGRLAGGIAHDFNNLLSVILSYSALAIADLPDDHPLLTDLREIDAAGHRAAALTRQLLAFSRRQVMEPRVVDLNDLLREMQKMLARILGEDVRLAFKLAKSGGRVRVDPTQIDQIVMNLAVNARDAMPHGGALTIETADVHLDGAYARDHIDMAPGAYVMLAVSDTGIGMDKETQARIFEPFFTTKETGKGTGLGLSTVFGIVKQSGGSIWVYSEPGRGTTFKIYLPVTRDADQPTTLRVPAVGSVDGTETILLVEDEDQVRQVARTILKRHGYAVLEAGGGAEAVAVAAKHAGTIDLLLTDVVMPVMGGREVAERLRADRPAMKVLYMSGFTDDAIVHHNVLEPGIRLLQKPITPDAFIKRIREILDG